MPITTILTFTIHRLDPSLFRKILEKPIFKTTTFSASQTTSYQIWYTYKTIRMLRTHLPSYQCTPPTFSIFSASHVPNFLTHFSDTFLQPSFATNLLHLFSFLCSHFSRTLLWYIFFPFQLFNQALPPTFSICSASHVLISLAHFSDTFHPFQLFNRAWSDLRPRRHNINSHILQFTDLILLSYLNFLKKPIFKTTMFSTFQTMLYQIWYIYKTIRLLRTRLPSYQCLLPTFSIF
jgi:hypothetical protein